MQFFGTKDVKIYIMLDFIDGKFSYNGSLFYQTYEFNRTMSEHLWYINSRKYSYSNNLLRFVTEYVSEKSLPFILIEKLVV